MAIFERSEGIYLVRVYVGRDPITKRRIEINKTVHGGRDDAERQERILKDKSKDGQVIKSPRMTVEQLFEFYSESTRRRRGRARQVNLTYSLKKYVTPHIGSLQISKITPHDIQRLFDYLLEPKNKEEMDERNKKAVYGLGLSITTMRGIRVDVNAAFNFAMDQDLILKNPVKKTVLPPPPLSAVNPFTIEEAWAFVSVKDLFWYGDAFSFQLQTGLRPGELMALIEEDIDFDKGELRIERACKWVRGSFTGFGTPKSRRSYRVIKLAPEHLEFLKTHLEKQKQHIRERTNAGLAYGEPKLDEWIQQERSKQRYKYTRTNLIFPSQAGNVSGSSAIRRSFKNMLRRAGFTGSRLEVRMYDLRHTHATILLTLGFPDHEVALRMGHTVDELNNTYAHEYKGVQQRASSMFLSLIPLDTLGLTPSSDIQHFVTNLKDKLNKDLEEGLKNLLKSGALVGA